MYWDDDGHPIDHNNIGTLLVEDGVCDVHGRLLRDEQCGVLAYRLAHRKPIRLRASLNRIGDAGAEKLAQLASLTDLDLGHNLIGDEGFGAIANSLTHLVKLDVSDNLIHDVVAVIDLLRRLQGTLKFISIEGNPLRWTMEAGAIPQTILSIRDPARLLQSLLDIRDQGDTTHMPVGRLTLLGPTGHGKTHLSLYLRTPGNLHDGLRRKQLRENDGHGTWGPDASEVVLRADQHGHPELSDVYLRLVDCGGHIHQMQSNSNLYYAGWERTVFMLCVRADSSFRDSWAEYQLGLVADLKAMTMWHRRKSKTTVESLEQEMQAMKAAPQQALKRKLRVVLVPTHADEAKKSGWKLKFPDDHTLIEEYKLFEVTRVDPPWDAIAGYDLSAVQKAIGVQLARMPELGERLPKYVQIIREAVEELFKNPEMPVNSISWKVFQNLCEQREIKNESGRHLTALQLLDSMSIVVAPDCYDEAIRDDMRILSPGFVQKVLFVDLLMPHARPKDGVIRADKYIAMTRQLKKDDLDVLEGLMTTCLMGFAIRERNHLLGWFIPDLLDLADDVPEWMSATFSMQVKTDRFLNESHFFEFLAEQFRLSRIESVIRSGEQYWSIRRDVVILSRDSLQARVTFDARGHRVGIEVRGGRAEHAKKWCNELALDWENRLGVKAEDPKEHKLRKVGRQATPLSAEQEMIKRAAERAYVGGDGAKPLEFANLYFCRKPTREEAAFIKKLFAGFRRDKSRRKRNGL